MTAYQCRSIVSAAASMFAAVARQPVAEMIANRIPATLELGIVALLISLVVGIPAGVYTATRHCNATDPDDNACGRVDPDICDRHHADFPVWVQLGWLPTFDRGGTVHIGGWELSLFTFDGWRSLILPAVTPGVYQLTLTMRLVRAQMMDVIRSDYIRFAMARGVPLHWLYFRHALANIMVPVITIIGL